MDKFNTEGLRSFYNQRLEKTFYVKSPNAEDIRTADWEYSKIYTKSLVAGITTTAEMMDILTRRGIIGPEFEQRSNELSAELAIKIQSLESSKVSEEKAALAYEVAKARDALFQWTQRLNQPLSNTCEQISDDARLEHLTARLIVDENGDNLWTDGEKYLHEKDQGLAQQAKIEVMLYLQGLDRDFLDKTPEAIAMKELELEAEKEAAEALEQLSKDLNDETTIEAENQSVEEVIEPTKEKVSSRKKK